ncbi:MAG: hypothetical protein ACI80V_003327 [Rhodothermales bacterium]|jgi:hypothetical protein
MLYRANLCPMPRISYFYGISIYMYFHDHAPPHFHARYGGDEVKIAIETGEVLAGGLPRRATRLVKMWRQSHSKELLERWDQARIGADIKPVTPLP